MNKNINDKNAPNQMRDFLKRMRHPNSFVEESKQTPKKDLSIRDMLKITRSINENVNRKTVYDQTTEEEKFTAFFDDMKVNIKFIELEIYDNFIFWGGTIDGVIQFVYKVTPDEKNSGVEFNYLNDFSEDNPENEEIVGRVESYYDTFYKYWRNNMLQGNEQ